MNDRLQIIKVYKKILKDVYFSMINIPRVHYSLKDFIIQEMYHYLEDLYLANDIKDERLRLIKKEELVIRIKYNALCQLIYKYRKIIQNMVLYI